VTSPHDEADVAGGADGVGAARAPVTPDDLDDAVRRSLAALGRVPAGAWGEPAGTLTWTRWETVEHLADDLFAYAAQLGPRPPPQAGEVPFLWAPRRPGGPANAIAADPDAGPAGLLQVLDACGALLVAMARTTPPDVRAHHGFGRSDAEGFAAMGVVEVLVHTHDLVTGLAVAWDPPAGPCARTLARLFPDAPAGGPPWPTLLWATGRGTLPGHGRRGAWRWHGAPPA
jgi:hypothetical protein